MAAPHRRRHSRRRHARRAGTAHAVLLTAAHVAAGQPAAAGTYWYVKERVFEPTAPGYAGKHRSKGVTAVKGPGYGASFAATEESWTGAARTPTIVNENLVFGFASAADKKRWEAAGSPKLANPSGKSGLPGRSPATTTISGKVGGTEAYLSMGWTNRLGTPSSSQVPKQFLDGLPQTQRCSSPRRNAGEETSIGVFTGCVAR